MKKKKKCEDSMPHTGGKYSTLTRDESKPQNKGKDSTLTCLLCQLKSMHELWRSPTNNGK